MRYIRLVPILELPVPPVWIMDRKLQRHPFDVRVIANSATTVYLSGRSRDLSEGGFGATFTKSLKLGEILRVSFLHSAEILTVDATVRYVLGFRHGLEFCYLSPAERLQLWKFLRRSLWRN